MLQFVDMLRQLRGRGPRFDAGATGGQGDACVLDPGNQVNGGVGDHLEGAVQAGVLVAHLAVGVFECLAQAPLERIHLRLAAAGAAVLTGQHPMILRRLGGRPVTCAGNGFCRISRVLLKRRRGQAWPVQQRSRWRRPRGEQTRRSAPVLAGVGAAISQGQTRDLRSVVKRVRGTTHLVLFDEDWADSDDARGVHAITESEAGLGVRTAVFDWDDARYTSTYRVERDPFG